MNVNKRIQLSLVAILLTATAFSQTALTVYPLSGSLGLKFASQSKFTPEIRIGGQLDMASGESNVYVKPELFCLYNYLREDNFQLYTGLGLGANLYNQSTSQFCGTLPFGGTYYLSDSKRFGIIAECGLQLTASDVTKVKTYASVGVQMRLCKKK